MLKGPAQGVSSTCEHMRDAGVRDHDHVPMWAAAMSPLTCSVSLNTSTSCCAHPPPLHPQPATRPGALHRGAGSQSLSMYFCSRPGAPPVDVAHHEERGGQPDGRGWPGHFPRGQREDLPPTTRDSLRSSVRVPGQESTASGRSPQARETPPPSF